MHYIARFDREFVSFVETNYISSVEMKSLWWACSCYQGRQESSSGHVSILVGMGQEAISKPDPDAGPDEGDPREKEPNGIGHSLIHLAAPGRFRSSLNRQCRWIRPGGVHNSAR